MEYAGQNGKLIAELPTLITTLRKPHGSCTNYRRMSNVRKFKWSQPHFPNSIWERKHQLPKMLIIRQLHVSEKPECKTVACT